MAKQQAFLIFYDDWDLYEEELTGDQIKELLHACKVFSQTGEVAEIADPVVRVLFKKQCKALASQKEHYEDTAKRQAEAGRKAAEARWQKPQQDNPPQENVEKTVENSDGEPDAEKNVHRDMRLNAIECETHKEMRNASKNAYTEKEIETETEIDYTTTTYNPPPTDDVAVVVAAGKDLGAALDAFGAMTGGLPSPANTRKIDSLLTAYGKDWVCEAFALAADNGRPTLAYSEGILKRWKREGKTPWGPAPSASTSTKGSVFTDFKQRDDDLEDMYFNF